MLSITSSAGTTCPFSVVAFWLHRFGSPAEGEWDLRHIKTSETSVDEKVFSARISGSNYISAVLE
jgi:hypothetical protein